MFIHLDVHPPTFPRPVPTPPCLRRPRLPLQVYAAELGLESEGDLRVNIGERLLTALFGRWAEVQGRSASEDDPPPLPFRDLEQVPQPQPRPRTLP